MVQPIRHVEKNNLKLLKNIQKSEENELVENVQFSG